MLRLLKRNPLLKIPQIHQIAQSQFPFLPNLVSNRNPANTPNDLYSFPLLNFSSATSNLRKESPEIKQSTFDFFHSYGFTDPQIKRFVGSIRSPEIMKPKLEHLLAFGLSPSELVRFICYDPAVLATSLNKRMKPNLNLLQATIGSKTHILKAIIHGPWLLRQKLEKLVIPNLKILRENGISMDNIIRLFTSYPTVLVKDPNVIIESITKLKGLGMNPSTLAFVYGMKALITSKKETWERKMNLYGNLGWSEEDTISAFARQPICMQLSEDKIKKNMKFFTEQLQWDSTMVAKRPVVLLLSLEARIIPFCAVLNELTKNGLWNGKPKLYGLLVMAEKKFKERYVDKYGKELPQVIDAYQGKIKFVGFESVDG